MTSSKPDCTVVIGAQWGNEGKGKLVHHLTRHADVCARFNGGANNVHTVTVEEDGSITMGRSAESSGSSRTITLRLLPLGVVHLDSKVVFGNGMMIHLPTLLEEIRAIQSTFDPNVLDRVYISTRAHVVFDFHVQADNLFDDLRENKLGTTQKGIGPAYSTKTIRNGIRFGDFFSDRHIVHEKVSELFSFFSQYTEFSQKFGNPDIAEIVDIEISNFVMIQHRVVDTVALMDGFLRSGNSIVCEGSNSVMSDLDFGTYPYVTSSNTTPGSAAIGLGFPPTKIGKVIGVCKAYTTRAQHWFPSIISDEATADRIRTAGNEFGTTTSSPRKIGWLDLVQVKYAASVSGFDSLMITKLEGLSGLDRVGVVVKYDNVDVDESGYPCTDEEFKRVKVADDGIEWFQGWSGLKRVERYADLPSQVKVFLKRIEEYVNVPVEFVQIGKSIIS